MIADKRTLWTFIVTTIALFMVVLDNLVVSTAIPVIRTELGASLEELEWTVNAFTLTFAVFLLTGAALGDRFGRKRMFLIGVAIFTVGSAAAALAPSADALIAARALQGLGGAIVTPLTLTLLSAAVPRREARGSRSAPGRGSPASPWRWGRWWAAPSSRGSPGSGSSGSTSRSESLAGARDPARRSRTGRTSRSIFRVSLWSAAGCPRDRLGPDPRQRRRLDERRSPRHPGRRSGAAGGLRRVRGCARLSRCCRCGSSATAGSPRRTPPRW